MTSGIKGTATGYSERGYRRLFRPDHPRAKNLRSNKSGYVYHTKERKEKGLCQN